jgi:hypothetical protein
MSGCGGPERNVLEVDPRLAAERREVGEEQRVLYGLAFDLGEQRLGTRPGAKEFPLQVVGITLAWASSRS